MNQIKKEWAAPKLMVHGDVEVLTQQSPAPKFSGRNDGQTVNGAPINAGPIQPVS